MQIEAQYHRAIERKYPEQIVIGIARDDQGKHNPITLGWTMIVSHAPPMMAVAIGRQRWSLAAFRQAREFVIAMPSEHQAAEAMLFGTKSGRDLDKFAEMGTVLQPARCIDAVLMADAVANFECRLTGEMNTGDHVTFVGEVVAAHVNEKRLSRLYTIGTGFKMAGIAAQQ